MKLIVVALSTLLTFTALVVMDRWLLPLFMVDGIVFPPNSTFVHETSEFSYTATINSLGFRDSQWAVERNKHIRILAIGDSFTFGWGVEDDESWPKVVEARLRKKGINVEIANLGQGGAGPRDI